MAMLTLDCPHCGKERMTFDTAGFKDLGINPHKGLPWASVAMFCRSCHLGVSSLLTLDIRAAGSPEVARFLRTGEDVSDRFMIERTWPERQAPQAPSGISPNVKRVFLEAEANRSRGSLESAGNMYRKALDIGTRELDASLAKLNLAPRLDRLAECGKLTVDIAAWAHLVRRLGNDTAHDDDVPTEQEVNDLANLTRMALVYLFEMPEKVASMREAAVAARREDAPKPP